MQERIKVKVRQHIAPPHRRVRKLHRHAGHVVVVQSREDAVVLHRLRLLLRLRDHGGRLRDGGRGCGGAVRLAVVVGVGVVGGVVLPVLVEALGVHGRYRGGGGGRCGFGGTLGGGCYACGGGGFLCVSLGGVLASIYYNIITRVINAVKRGLFTLGLASFFALGLALVVCDGVGGAAGCCGDEVCVRPFAA